MLTRNPANERGVSTGVAAECMSLCFASFSDFALWRWAARLKAGSIRHSLARDHHEAPELGVPFVSNLKQQHKVSDGGCQYLRSVRDIDTDACAHAVFV